MTGPYPATPNAERYILAADALRRRQLTAALLHGSGRTWRDRRRIWPAAVAGLVAAVLIAAVVAIAVAFTQQRDLTEQQEQERQRRHMQNPGTLLLSRR